MIDSATTAQGLIQSHKAEGILIPPKPNILGCITGSYIDDYFICKPTTIIGRNSAQGLVDLHINLSSYISRKHAVIKYNGKMKVNSFTMNCVGKNGVFVNGNFHKGGTQDIPLNKEFVYFL